MSSRTERNCTVISKNNNKLIREIIEAEKMSRLEENCVTKPCLNLSEKRINQIILHPDEIKNNKEMSYCLKRQVQIKKKKYKSELQVSAAWMSLPFVCACAWLRISRAVEKYATPARPNLLLNIFLVLPVETFTLKMRWGPNLKIKCRQTIVCGCKVLVTRSVISTGVFSQFWGEFVTLKKIKVYCYIPLSLLKR